MKKSITFKTIDEYNIFSEEGISVIEYSVLFYVPLNKSAYDNILGEGQSDLAINSGVS